MSAVAVTAVTTTTAVVVVAVAVVGSIMVPNSKSSRNFDGTITVTLDIDSIIDIIIALDTPMFPLRSGKQLV